VSDEAVLLTEKTPPGPSAMPEPAHRGAESVRRNAGRAVRRPAAPARRLRRLGRPSRIAVQHTPDQVLFWSLVLHVVCWTAMRPWCRLLSRSCTAHRVLSAGGLGIRQLDRNLSVRRTLPVARSPETKGDHPK